MHPLAMLLTSEFEDSDLPNILKEILDCPKLCTGLFIPSETATLMERMLERIVWACRENQAGVAASDIHTTLELLSQYKPHNLPDLVENTRERGDDGYKIIGDKVIVLAENDGLYSNLKEALDSILNYAGCPNTPIYVGRLTSLLYCYLDV